MDDWNQQRERALDKAHEQEPRRTHVARRHLSPHGTVRIQHVALPPIIAPEPEWRPGECRFCGEFHGERCDWLNTCQWCEQDTRGYTDGGERVCESCHTDYGEKTYAEAMRGAR